MSATATYKLPGFEFDSLRQYGSVYISAREIIAHLEKSAKAADEVAAADVAKVLRLYRTALVEAVAGVA